jgi:hypothetical protein
MSAETIMKDVSASGVAYVVHSVMTIYMNARRTRNTTVHAALKKYKTNIILLTNRMQAYHKSETFLTAARAAAEKRGYDPAKLELATNGVNKLTYHSPKGVKHFGRLGYGDFLWYSTYDKTLADKKKAVFRRSHAAISDKYDLDKYSPNELAINILW